jgi:DNA-binding XRE family transcriptional regulator
MDSREAGREAVFFGHLTELRLKLGLSKAALAEILGVSTMTLYRWESYGMLDKLNNRNAEKVDEFCQTASALLEMYPDFKERFVTFAIAAQKMGITHELLFHFHREGIVKGLDFGILGLFLPRKHGYSFPRSNEVSFL